MAERELELLGEITGVITPFRCAGYAPRQLEEFGAVVTDLPRPEAQGYISQCGAMPEPVTGRRGTRWWCSYSTTC